MQSSWEVGSSIVSSSEPVDDADAECRASKEEKMPSMMEMTTTMQMLVEQIDAGVMLWSNPSREWMWSMSSLERTGRCRRTNKMAGNYLRQCSVHPYRPPMCTVVRLSHRSALPSVLFCGAQCR